MKRGEIWLVDLGLAQKVRPAVILSVAFLDHARSLVTYFPRTASLRNTRFEVTHHGGGFAAGVFDAQSIGVVPTVRLIRRLGALDGEVLSQVDGAVRRWLAL